MFKARPTSQDQASTPPSQQPARQQKPADVQRLSRLTAAAVALALLALGVGSYMTASANARMQALAGQTSSVVVMACEVQPGATIAAGDVATREMPTDSLPAGAITDAEEAVGKTATGYLAAGTVLTSGSFTGKNAASAAGRIDAGMVAVTVTVNQQTGVAGLVRQGDRVSVLSALKGQGEASAQVLAQHAEVIALDANLDGYSADYTAVTVKLAPAEAQKVVSACAEGQAAIALESSAS